MAQEYPTIPVSVNPYHDFEDDPPDCLVAIVYKLQWGAVWHDPGDSDVTASMSLDYETLPYAMAIKVVVRGPRAKSWVREALQHGDGG
jgi:hypothetical protein